MTFLKNWLGKLKRKLKSKKRQIIVPILRLSWKTSPKNKITIKSVKAFGVFEMLNQNFKSALNHVLKIEGGYSNHPMDKGGPTNLGITLERLRSFRGDQSLGAEDVKKLTLEDVAPIYKKDYWDVWRLDDVKSDIICLVLFDQAVNWGVGRPTARRVQQALIDCGQYVKLDGIIGTKTIHALNKVNERIFAMEFISDSQDAYVRLVKKKPHYKVFIEGWINRTQALYAALIEKLSK